VCIARLFFTKTWRRLIYVSFFRNQVDGVLAVLTGKPFEIILFMDEAGHEQHPGLVIPCDMLHQPFDVQSTIRWICNKDIIVWISRGILPYVITVFLFVINFRKA